MTASIYEREIKSILSGNEKIINKIGLFFPPEVINNFRLIKKIPFIVIRGAGSLGFDLVALRGEFAFPIEVKCSSSDTIRFSTASGRLEKQANIYIKQCIRSRLVPIYIYRKKSQEKRLDYDPWRLFTLQLSSLELTGRSKLIYERIPKISETVYGYKIVRWSEGLPLNKFIEYIYILLNNP